MSFCNNNGADRCPGNISGNPINGLSEKVCIQARKVFDACMTQSTLESTTVTLTNLTPADPALPLTFVSGQSTTSVGTVTALTVTPLSDRQGLSRVQATISIPVVINYTDANGGKLYSISTTAYENEKVVLEAGIVTDWLSIEFVDGNVFFFDSEEYNYLHKANLANADDVTMLGFMNDADKTAKEEAEKKAE